MRVLVLAGAAALALAGCHPSPPPATAPASGGGVTLVDPRATAETRALFANLRRLAGTGTLFGHENDLAYGLNWRGEPGRSDVKETSGSYPAVVGWDVNTLFARGGRAATEVPRLRQWIAETYGRGGVIEMAWHQDNPVSGGNAWDTTRAVDALLPGGAKHEWYKRRLDTVADFFNTLRARGPDGRETLVPVVFRPYHETSGSWFWWGGRHRSAEEFRELWRFTVRYLRDERQVHNLLWAYSTDVFDSKDDYLRHWPGDAFVDVLGFDDYGSIRTVATQGEFRRRMRDVVELADAKGKIAALTETGVETVPDSTWWTRVLLPAMKGDSVARRIAWVLVWRNANMETDRKNHFYAPYAGHPSAPDFRRFRDDAYVLFEDELPNLYVEPVGALVDGAATAETRALRHNLGRLAATGVLFGHEDDLAYGYGWKGEAGRSDVKETAGDYPAVYGWDVAGIEHDASANIDGVPFDRMRGWIAEGFRRGGVITVSWHMDNPASGGNAWDTTQAVRAILPGGARHAGYRASLDRFARFAGTLRASRTRGGPEVAIPIVFRPFHEMNGSWFWWGGRNASPADYRALWRFTVQYLRDDKGLHNLLWAWSPNAAGGETRARYLDYYPGDAWVDVMGLDEYFRGDADAGAALTDHLRYVVEEAERRGKLPALTETGYEGIPDSTWWTRVLLPAVRDDAVARRIAWVLVWRNATKDANHPRHHYAPYAGHASAADFRRFREDPFVLFESELPDLYR
jgi:mannan endo-1,4-beta-mannosidase